MAVETLKAEDVNVEIHRLDYEEPFFFVSHTQLDLQLDYESTKVETILRLYRNKATSMDSDLILHGGDTISIESIRLKTEKDFGDGQLLQLNEDYRISPVDFSLTINGNLLPKSSNEFFNIIINLSVNPSKNTQLSGLYKAGPILCTQMEAEGFRRLTYSLDRPDVTSTYRVRLEADKSTFPVLLSNGNQIESGEMPNGRHFVLFDDPFPKPSYLFAIVAGSLVSKEDSFIRSVGKPVRLSLWCEAKDANKLDWALESLKKAMKWDEERFGRVYDLDWFNIVAVSYFNMGAMENKSLNIFNSAALLGNKQFSTDGDLLHILEVVGHEYFHNWTGNRVTVRDWFQLTLKEGLTNYRDQEFSMDMGSRPVQRIQQVLSLRASQFPEDFGPLAHPIRPESYRQIENFYTATVYTKGAEVIRMYEKILGREGFRKGMDLYFQRHDGSSVTCDDFRKAMSDSNGVDLTQFERWYSQAGTPTVTVESMVFNESQKTYTIELKQTCNDPAKKTECKPFHIPVALGLIGRQSRKELLSTTVQFTNEKQTFVFDAINENPVLSIFRGFSAPVKVVSPMSDSDFEVLMSADTDGFNRWEAGQKLITKAVLERARKIRDFSNDDFGSLESQTMELVVKGFKTMLKDVMEKNETKAADLYLISYSLIVPTVSTLMPDFIPCNPMALQTARKDVKKFIGITLQKEFSDVYESLTKLTTSRDWDLSIENIGMRSLRNTALSYLTVATDNVERAIKHYKAAGDNMNDRFAAFSLLLNYPNEETKTFINDFLVKAAGDDHVIDSWFSAQAAADHEHVLEEVKQLKKHQLFTMTNPNRMRALISAFSLNPYFHHINGEGYKFVADTIIELDKINSIMAASVAKSLVSWKIMDEYRQQLMKAELENLCRVKLSAVCSEIVAKGLTFAS